MMRVIFIRFLAAVFVFLVFAPALAGAQSAVPQADPQRIIRPVTVLDPLTLLADNTQITLWGIRPAGGMETPLGLKAVELMDSLVGNDPVNCRVTGQSSVGVIARCTLQNNSDLGMELLNQGYAVVDRRQVVRSELASAYMQAQDTARTNERGVWQPSGSEGGSSAPKWLQPYLAVLVPLFLFIGPFGGLLAVAWVMHYRLKKMETVQKEEFDEAQRKESVLLVRERYVLISTLEGELIENKNRIEAFLVVYGDLLRSLKDPNEVPQYQKGGDIVQKNPALSKTVFEANVSKFSLLDIKLAGQLSKLYTSLPKEQEYINIEPSVPRETAIKLVEKVLKDAEEKLPPIMQAISALGDVIAKKTG